MARCCLFTCNHSLSAIFKRTTCIVFNQCPNVSIHHSVVWSQDEESTKNSDDHNSQNDLKTLKINIIKAGLTFVPEYGWNEKSLALGAKSLGLSSAAHRLVKGGGSDLVHYFNHSCNLKLEDYMEEFSSTNEKFNLQEFMTDALEKRLKMLIPYLPKWPEAMALMALPTQLPIQTRNMLDLVDSIWHFYGDKSVDMSWYSKRLLLTVAYKTSELSLIQDKSPEYSDTFDFLQRRIENVVETEDIIKMTTENGRHLIEFGGGAFITARNLFGLNKWFR